MASVPFDVATSLVRHGAAMRALAHELVCGGIDADDVVQETWLRAMRRPPADGGTSGWFATVLKNVVRRSRRDQVRRVRREAAVAREDGVEDHAHGVAREESARRLLAAIETLDAATRDVVWRRFFEGQPPREIARERGEPVATVKSRLQRGIRDLREQLGKDGDGEWRAALVSAFGLGKPGAVAAALGGGVLMTTWMKMAAAAVVMLGALAFGSGWFVGRDASVDAGSSTVAPGPAVAVVDAPGVVRPGERERVASAAAAVAVVPPSAPSARCSGRLVAAETQQPLGGVTVLFGDITGPAPGDPRVVSADDGRFEIAVAAEGTPTLWFEHPERAALQLPVPPLLAGEADDLGDVALARGRTLSGRVVDTAGTPLPAGTRLLAHLVQRWDSSPPGNTTTSRATLETDGRFTMPSLPFGEVTIQLLADHELVNGVVRIDEQVPVELSLVAKLRPFVAGHVVDTHGNPAAGVRLALVPPTRVITTGADGSFRLFEDMPMGMPARIAVHSAPDHVPPAGATAPDMAVCAENVAWGTSDLRIVLERAATLPIEVVGDDGEPVENFGVVLDRPLLGELRAAVRQRGHHARGRLEVGGVALGTTSFRVVPVDPSLSPSDVLPVESIASRRVVLRKRVPCAVQVVKNGRPVANVCVDLVRTPFASPLRFAPTATQRPRLLEPHSGEHALPGESVAERIAGGRTDANGIVRMLRDIAVEQRALLVQADGFAPTVLDEPTFPADGSPLRVTLPDAGYVDGSIELRGRTGRDLEVWLAQGQQRVVVRVRGNGSFRSPPLATGTWRAELRSKGALVGGERDVQIADGATTTIAWDLAALGGASVRGHLVRAGAAFTGLTVDVSRVGEQAVPEPIRRVEVGADGRFEARDLGPGTYRIVVRSADPLAVLMPWIDGSQLQLGGSDHRDLEIVFPQRRLVVHFRRPDGTAVRGERVLARCDGVQWTFPFGIPVDEQVVIDPAPALPIEFRSATSQVWSAPVQMPADRAEAEVTVVLPDPPK